jgi:Zn finger protein HypA/HybF involved in hydrogenase expression
MIKHSLMFSYELTCRHCGWRTVCGLDGAIARLRLIGQLRRDKEPDESIVESLLLESAPRMTCPICKEKQLWAQPSTSEEDETWATAVLCDICREPIAPERLEAIPNVKRCAACATRAEKGELSALEPDFCPHCGSLVEVRVSRGGGITRYKRVCSGDPPCRL